MTPEQPFATERLAAYAQEGAFKDMPPQLFADRPWDAGNNPKTTARQWLASQPDFSVDRSMESRLMVTVAPEGFLKRHG